MRINKYLADSGVASRRKCEEIILSGVVKVNGKAVTNLATDISETDSVTVNGKAVKPAEVKAYYMFNKPKGCITTASDEKGRKTIFDYIKVKHIRLHSVGRLDYDTEGLLILTNDGELTRKLTHPSHEVPKTYVAVVEGAISDDELKKLATGVVMDDGYKTRPARVNIIKEFSSAEKHKDINFKESRVEITITEGKNRQVRKMFEAIGKNVLFLKRTQVGGLRLGGLSRGELRELSPKEVNHLKSL